MMKNPDFADVAVGAVGASGLSHALQSTLAKCECLVSVATKDCGVIGFYHLYSYHFPSLIWWGNLPLCVPHLVALQIIPHFFVF